MTQEQLSIDPLLLKNSAQPLRAINHKLRQKIILLLHTKLRATVTTVYHELELEQSVASQHLAILRKAGIVTTERQGKFILYSVNYQRLNELEKCAAVLLHVQPPRTSRSASYISPTIPKEHRV